jgi:D-alanine-D-alanine ligase
VRRVWVLYNTDYDAELTETEGVDVSAVEEAARALCEAVGRAGYDTELLGVQGMDLPEVFERLNRGRPDQVFNLVESLAGDVRNEPLMPVLLDMLRIPYTGTDALGLGLCLHKDRTKDVLAARGIASPEHRVLATEADLTGPDARALDELPYPMFLKLCHEDASIGIEATNVARDRAGLVARAGELLRKYRQPVIAERFVDGREVNVTLIGNGDALEVLPLHEIDFSAMPADRPRIISYAAKWDESHVDYDGTKPVPMTGLTPALAAAIESIARASFRATGLRDFGRVDLRVDATGQPWVIDVNPNCDLSPDAGVARAARHAGVEYHELIGRIIEIAWRRHAEHSPGPGR